MSHFRLSFPRTPAVLLAALVPLALSAPASAVEETAEGSETTERLDTLERAVEVLAEEQDRLRKLFAVPEGGLTSYAGLGPAASKVYFKDRGLSIGGYGEWRGRAFVNDNQDDIQNELDMLRAVLYVGYKFSDRLVMNSEFELEHATTGGDGAFSVEFLTLDFLGIEEANLRAGLVLLPMGFINEIHEPNFFFGLERPEVERRIIPTTWRENGAGLYGRLFERLSYRVYAVNGLDATGFDATGLRGGRQKGSEALADHWAVVGRVDFDVADGVVVGGSVYYGDSGQNQDNTLETTGGSVTRDVPDTPVTLWEVHAEVERAGFSLRGLYAQAHLGSTRRLNRSLFFDPSTEFGVAERMMGGYGEIAYDVMPWLDAESEMSLEPFYRYEVLDTQQDVASGFAQDGNRDRSYHVAGLQFKPHPQVVIKLDYRNISADDGQVPDEVQFGFGYVF